MYLRAFLRTPAPLARARTRAARCTRPPAMSARIGTHHGAFHCDEAVAVYVLRSTPQFARARVVRTRDPARLAECDAVVDVGGVYDPDARRFDHHQRGFEELGATGIKLSSAGLVWRHYGREVVRAVCEEAGVKCEEGDVEVVWARVYERFVAEVDAVDNGVERVEGGGEPRYECGSTIGARVGRLNAAWNEESGEAEQAARFEKAVAMVGGELDECILQCAKIWLPAKGIVGKAMAARFDVREDGAVLVMREWAPWKDHLYRVEREENDDAKRVKYVVYKDITGGSWRIQAVPVSKNSFSSRVPLPEPWRGLRDEELSSLSGIPGCVFVHASGFIGGNATYEGALAMAEKSLAISA